MKTKLTSIYILQLLLVGMSNLSFGQIDKYNQNDGIGLHFPVDTPKHGITLKVESVNLNNEFLYTKFYEDAYGNVYLINKSDSLFPVSTLDSFSKFNGFDKPVDFEKREEYRIEYVDEESEETKYEFVRPAKNQANTSFYISTIKDVRYQLQLLDPRDGKLHFHEILQQIEGLGLNLYESKSYSKYGRNSTNDQLFVLDADPKKILVVWHDQNQIFANFISPKGKWLLSDPVEIHKKPKCAGESNTGTSNSDTMQITSLQSLKIQKHGDNYYVGYGIFTWEPNSNCFHSNMPSFHMVKLNDKLEVLAQKQIPDEIDGVNRIFSTELSFNFQVYDKGIQCFFLTSGYRSSKVFTQNLSTNLADQTELIYLSNQLRQFNSDQTVATKFGTAFLYTQNTIYDSKWYLQGFEADGTPKKPLNIRFPYSFREYANMGLPTMTYSNDTFHFYVLSSKGNNTKFLHYTYAASDYLNDLNYNIDSTNWTKDIRIMEVDSLVKYIDSVKYTDDYQSFYKSSPYKNKRIYVGPELKPFTYTVTESSYNDLRKYTFYYDKFEKIRFIDVYESFTYPKKTIRYTKAYCDRFGNIIWIKVVANGTTSYSPNVRDFTDRLYGFGQESPIESFRK